MSGPYKASYATHQEFCNFITKINAANREYLYLEVGKTIRDTLQTKKVYKDECPCGIHPIRCDYHRDNRDPIP